MSCVMKQQDGVTIKPDTDVVASTANAFRTELKGLIDEGARAVTIDLAGVQMVDSVGLGVFIAAHNTLNQSGGRLIVSNASDDIVTLLKTMRLDQHFTVLATEKEMGHE
jgi:anti-sigma B factor antagonist